MYNIREKRAINFANSIINALGDLLPSDSECMEIIYQELYKIAYEGNLQIINVPLEYDALDKLELERTMLKTKLEKNENA